MKRRKDNLTDAIEVFQENDGENNSSEENDYEVVDNEGEIVTLGIEKDKIKSSSNKSNVIKLNIKNKIEKMIEKEIEKELKNISDKIMKKVQEKLNKSGIFKK